MKKLTKTLASTLATLLVLPSITACGPTSNNNVIIDKNKTQVYFQSYAGGFGHDWALELAARFNEKQPADGIQAIVLDPTKDDVVFIAESIKAGTAVADIWQYQPTLARYIRQGLLMDITDVYNSESDNGVTIKNKIRDLDEFDSAVKYQEKYYMLPWNEGLILPIADYELFTARDWLIKDEQGNLSVGNDGKPGTYDDGMPVTMEEWDEMVANIASAGDVSPFINSNTYNFYTEHILNTVWAMYDGKANYRAATSFNGNYTSPTTGDVTALNSENGYLAYEIAEGREKAISEFAYYYFNKNYLHPDSLKTSSHTDAQATFVMGSVDSSIKKSAMLFDGIWWENESHSLFNSIGSYGTHDYRMMLLPQIDGGVEDPDGNGTAGGSIVTALENNVLFAKAQTDQKKETAVKEFMKYLVSDEALGIYISMTGAMVPYKFNLSTPQYDNLTKFGKSVYNIYSDTENVAILRPVMYEQSSEMCTLAQPSAYMWGNIDAANGQSYSNPWAAFVNGNMTAEGVISGLKANYTQAKWQTMLNSLPKD